MTCYSHFHVYNDAYKQLYGLYEALQHALYDIICICDFVIFNLFFTFS